MGIIEDTIEVYERLRKYKYKVIIEDGAEVVLDFLQEYYHHLIGLHYLTDLPDISNPRFHKRRFYSLMKASKIKGSYIEKSVLFSKIFERVSCFGEVEDVLSEPHCKIIVDFDAAKANSDIEAKYFLFKRVGNPWIGEPVTYYQLFLGYDSNSQRFYPATFLVEHSNLYINGQEFKDCRIERVPAD